MLNESVIRAIIKTLASETNNKRSKIQGINYKEIFEKFDDCWSEYTSYAEEAIFTYAFKLGMQIAIETLTE